MVFVNNLALLHSRDGFEDSTEHVRYALRVWLKNEELSWKIPKPLLLEWESTFTPIDGVEDSYDSDPWSDKQKANDMVRGKSGGPSTKCG